MKKYLIVFLIIVSLVFTACNSKQSVTNSENTPLPATKVEASKASGYANITPLEAKKRLDHETGIILLDVREQDEYAEEHLKDSILLPVGSIEAEAAGKLINKDDTIFVYCRSGRRSALAADALVKMGYTKVFDLGGIIDWPYEVVK